MKIRIVEEKTPVALEYDVNEILHSMQYELKEKIKIVDVDVKYFADLDKPCLAIIKWEIV